jgi:hypothetical protein
MVPLDHLIYFVCSCRQIEEGGQVFEGSWKEDSWDGEGTLTFAGGGTYVGSFRKDKLHGQVRPRKLCCVRFVLLLLALME